MNSIPITNTNVQVNVAASEQNRENNLSNGFSARPLGKESPCQGSQKKRYVRIAIAVVAVTALVFVGYKLFYSPINCNRIDFGFSGELECQFENGASYKGYVDKIGLPKGVLSGRGCYTNISGEEFCGTFKANRFQSESRSIGMRTLDQCKKATLTDCFAALRNEDCETIGKDFSGELECEYDDGAKYKGSVRAGEFSGKGCYTNPRGEEFCGTFKKNKFEHTGEFSGKWILDQCKPASLTACVKAILSRKYFF